MMSRLTQLETLWRQSGSQRPGGNIAQAHVLELIDEVRKRDEHIAFLLDALQRPGVGLFEAERWNAGEWYLLYNTDHGGIEKVDLPDDLQQIMNERKAT